ncbi:MAG TPA: hypothetical protein GXX29_05285 [Firmicutes bacterium]|nr:hypothetical protein [Bacillota bacterium]
MPIAVPAAICRFALLGDVEPKPDPVFLWFDRAIALINRLNEAEKIDFTACVGDMIHGGKLIQYQGATAILKKLVTPFYTIMGNEELNEGRELYLTYAAQWNDDPGEIPDISYVKEYGGIRFVFATAEDRGKTFSQAEADWIAEQLRSAPQMPVMLFTHASIAGIFPEAGPRAQKNDLLKDILRLPNLTAVFTGHTHLNLDQATTFVLDEHGLAHIHLPGIERTKVGGEHIPRLRVATVYEGGEVLIQTYNLIHGEEEPKHRINFVMRFPPPPHR